MTGADFIKTLQWNLTRFEGYVGVNNHMGSKLTTDAAAMKTVLAYLQKEGLFFLDSLTTSDSAARRAGVAIGARVFSRDVFLDPEGADRAAIKKQIALAERIALETGFAVAIGHPRRDTIEILGPWLASAPLRGFDLAPVSALIEIDEGFKEPALLAAAPPLRL
jgi:hypothetical protein